MRQGPEYCSLASYKQTCRDNLCSAAACQRKPANSMKKCRGLDGSKTNRAQLREMWTVGYRLHPEQGWPLGFCLAGWTAQSPLAGTGRYTSCVIPKGIGYELQEGTFTRPWFATFVGLWVPPHPSLGREQLGKDHEYLLHSVLPCASDSISNFILNLVKDKAL